MNKRSLDQQPEILVNYATRLPVKERNSLLRWWMCTTREITLALFEPRHDGIVLKAILNGMYVRMLDDLHRAVWPSKLTGINLKWPSIRSGHSWIYSNLLRFTMYVCIVLLVASILRSVCGALTHPTPSILWIAGWMELRCLPIITGTVTTAKQPSSCKGSMPHYQMFTAVKLWGGRWGRDDSNMFRYFWCVF